jgi:hypothetical protein
MRDYIERYMKSREKTITKRGMSEIITGTLRFGMYQPEPGSLDEAIATTKLYNELHDKRVRT